MIDMAHIPAERAVLGTILIAGDQAAFLVKSVDVDDFSLPSHRQVFEAMQAEVQKGCAPNGVVVSRHFVNTLITGLQPLVYLAKLMQDSVAPPLALDCIKSLKEYTCRRQMHALASTLSTDAKSISVPVVDSSLAAISTIDTIVSKLRGSRKTTTSIGEAARQLIDKIRSGEKEDLITTGLLDLDAMIGGWHRGEMAVVAARPSMGKTTFMLSALRQAAHRGVCSAFFSLEMRTEAVMQRMFSDLSWNAQTAIPYVRIGNYNLSEPELERLDALCPEFDALPLIIDDQPMLTVTEIGVRARRMKDQFERQGKTLDVVCIDHLGKIAGSGKYDGHMVNETGEKSGELAALARELNVAMVVIHQLNRESERRADNHPMLSDLRDSGNVEQDADTVCFVHREAYASERSKFSDPESETRRMEIAETLKHDMDLIIAKNRNGPCGVVELFVDMSSNAVRDRVRKDYSKVWTLREAS